MYCLLVLLFFSAQLFAQPWQWEVYPGDYYNPTGFPFALTDVCVGDFNGDGRGEVIGPVGSEFRIATKDSGAFHWTTAVSENAPGWGWGQDAYDLDGDGADELVVAGDMEMHAYKAVVFDPWTWELRDSLIAGFETPEFFDQAVFGDFDQDGLLNGFYMTGSFGLSFFELRERQNDGTWVTDTTFQSVDGVSSGIYAGDFDHDGDRDFAIAPLLTDVPPFGGFGENTPQGIVWHLFPDYWPLMNFPGPTGGDVDGDGQWEGLYWYHHNMDDGYPGYMLVEMEPDSQYFLSVAVRRYLGSLPGPVFSNFRVNGQTVVGAIRNWTWGEPFYANDSFACMVRTDSGWQDFYSGFYPSWPPYGGYQCIGGNRADLDGDGRSDILAVLLDTGWATYTYWGIWKNHGTADQDSFSFLYQLNDYFTHRFLTNSDTSFGYPQIGDINGDGRAELAVVAVPTGGARQVLFYEMVGEIEDTNFVMRPEWSASLPTGWDRIRLADIDGDNLAELIAREQSGSWRTFFWRDMDWEEYSNILPPTTDANISFADADNDGDLDLFTPTQLYYSLSPSGAPSDFIPHPSSLILSAFPNPFNGEVTITYEVPQRGNVELAVYNLLGERVAVLKSGMEAAGSHSVQWQPEVSSGIYFVRLNTPPLSPPLKQGGSTLMRKVVYLR